MDNIIVITQNVKLNSLGKLREYVKPNSSTLVISTQFIFENEVEIINSALQTKCEFLNFSDILSDKDWEECDRDALGLNYQNNVYDYYEDIKTLKNQRILDAINKRYGDAKTKLIVCDDLGLDMDVWLAHGFTSVSCEYYNNEKKSIIRSVKRPIWYRFLRFLWHRVIDVKNIKNINISVAYSDNKKYLFYGSLNRIQYRLNLTFTKASSLEWFRLYMNNWGIIPKNKTIRLSTLHEGYNILPDHPNMNLKLMQDGYLPPNYSSKYLDFYGKYTEFYTWDALGKLTFEYHSLPNRIIPFRNKLYLPSPNYPNKIKKVLCVASGAGDWTAVKNRSDEDKMIFVFGKIAALYPDIEFVYRCHPVWIHPLHQGVNSINRAAEYIEYLRLPNFKISCNIPNAIQNGKFILSYKRSSLDEDLKDVDIVFGEHSISMIDAAFKKILFASCNVTGRRDFFAGITALGFPHCESIEEIKALMDNITTSEFMDSYELAIKNYNEMTDIE